MVDFMPKMMDFMLELMDLYCKWRTAARWSSYEYGRGHAKMRIHFAPVDRTVTHSVLRFGRAGQGPEEISEN